MSDIADILGLGQDASSNSLQNKDAANLLQSFQKPKGTMGAPKQKKTKTKIYCAQYFSSFLCIADYYHYFFLN